MRLTLLYHAPTPEHCRVSVWVEGALTGTLTLRQRELSAFQAILARGCAPGTDEFIVRGNPDPGSWSEP